MFRIFPITLILALVWLLPTSADDAKKEVEALKGTWKVTKATRNGQPDPASDKGLKLLITEDEITPEVGGRKEVTAKYKLDPSKSPKQIDITPPGQEVKGIYDLKGDSLRICFNRKGERPAAFDATGEDLIYVEAIREKK